MPKLSPRGTSARYGYSTRTRVRLLIQSSSVSCTASTSGFSLSISFSRNLCHLFDVLTLIDITRRFAGSPEVDGPNHSGHDEHQVDQHGDTGRDRESS